MLWVGQFGIVDGQAREESPWVGVFADDGRPAAQTGEGKADLFVVVEPALPGSEDYCRDLSRAIGEQFRQHRLSLTGGILRALKAAHENLRDWNRRSLKQHRVAAGASCLAVRDGEAYLGQVGPAAAVILRQGELTRLAPALPDAIEPLGLHEEFWPDFSRHELSEGDRLLLLSRNLAEALSDDELRAALTPPPEETLPVLYAKAKALPNCAAVLVAALAAPEAGA
jgi:serine/threonine protein phosphatase PrpC